jgi:hypothetical protein
MTTSTKSGLCRLGALAAKVSALKFQVGDQVRQSSSHSSSRLVSSPSFPRDPWK